MELSSIIETVGKAWNFKLFVAEGTPITLGTVVIGIFLFIASYFVARFVSRSFGKRVLRRLSVQNSLKYTLERIVFYAFYIFLVLFVMQILSIPLTIFSVIGGALALGIGFGSQNVVNNFISGLIVMIEQPVRVHDWIEIDGVFGHIEEIGGRSTVMKRLDNKQVIIPNSFFLEKAFVNWTLSDPVVGGNVTIGVAYGSDVRKVKKLILQAASEHNEVIQDPAPDVHFNDFGSSSLDFILYFRMRFSGELTVYKVASDLRFRIDELFRENQISIPFPHRQLLFDKDNPLPVKVSH